MVHGIDHANFYLIRDGQGWYLFDTGADCEAARALSLRGFPGPIRLRSGARHVVTLSQKT